MLDNTIMLRISVLLKRVRHKYPYLRFGQLLVNMLKSFEKETGVDPFYANDEELVEFLEEYSKRETE